PIGGAVNRPLKLLKMRGVHHGEGVYPYLFARGVGIVVRARPVEIPDEQTRSHGKVFENAIKTAEGMKAPTRVVERIRRMQKSWDYEYSPEEALQILFNSYGLKRGGSMPYAGQVDKTVGAETVGHVNDLLDTESRR